LSRADGRGNSRVDVTVRTSNKDVKVGLHVAIVVGVIQRDKTAPPDTLDAGKRWWVRAGILVWSKSWITLKVDVERGTTADAGTLGTARGYIVRVEESETHVVVGRVGSNNVAEDLGETGRGHSGGGDVGIVRVVLESLWGVWSRGVSNAGRLSDTDVVTLAKSGGGGGD